MSLGQILKENSEKLEQRRLENIKKQIQYSIQFGAENGFTVFGCISKKNYSSLHQWGIENDLKISGTGTGTVTVYYAR